MLIIILWGILAIFALWLFAKIIFMPMVWMSRLISNLNYKRWWKKYR